ncbi:MULTISPECIES: STAS domain-containing protein [Actinosynnema]|uniref:STAS domain-containing protein n=1 Tax=Actinosynnema TaxID=40566 RepID=UPI0020A44CB0|nr:STAS domain-containing protein [Actinosynnema pretiosum]MCP2098245.1 rsbT co-antagonist protein RsbR [Actinosynnema pretiosum]
MVADAGQGSEHRLTGLLRNNAGTVIARWGDAVLEQIRGRVTKAELERDFGELYTALLHVVDDRDHYQVTDRNAEVKALLEDMSRNRARQGYTPSETASSIFALKRVVFELADELPETDTDLFRQLMGFSQLLDALGLITFETYSRAREEIIQEQSEQLLELTTPVVKIWEGILAVPLVGTLDSARTQVVMEKLLEALVETGSEHAIIDITGVLAVDTQVAQHLLKTVVAARLMGAECTISGIRPQIAQTIVALGIEFGDITTKASLSDALRHALRREGVEVTHDRSAR